MTSPILTAIDSLTPRHPWAETDTAFIRRCRQIDKLNGIEWDNQSTRDAEAANNCPATDQ